MCVFSLVVGVSSVMSKRKLASGEEPPDPDTMHPDDFENPYEVFYWLGYFAGKRRGDSPLPEKKPLCETDHFCVFDTETSGLSCNDCTVQMALGFFNEDGRPLGFYDRFWKLPPGVTVSRGSYRIHKISMCKLEDEGYEAAPEVRKIMKIMQRMRDRGKRIVAHNAAFDCRILAQTARHHGVDGWDISKKNVFCTMGRAKPWCKLKSKKTGRPKAPSNSELYKILTGLSPTGALHDALVDIKVTARSYVEGAKRGWW